MISSAAERRAPLTPDVIRATGLIMSFLTLCCETSPRLCCGISVSALLSTVTIYASRMDTPYLSCHVLTLFSSLEGSRVTPPNKSLNTGFDKIPWEIALSCPRSDILIACKSAHFNTPNSSLRVAQRALHLAYWPENTFKVFTHLLLSESGIT